MKDELPSFRETTSTKILRAAKKHIVFAPPRSPLLPVSFVTATDLQYD
jgi:hypothetical protein